MPEDKALFAFTNACDRTANWGRYKKFTGLCTYDLNSGIKIDDLVKETKNSIELLKEHRSALISAAVTGKIDVRSESLE